MSALNPTARDLAKVLKRLETRITDLERGARTSQLQHASLTGTAIAVYDEDGVTPRGAIGIQPDGTLGLVAVGGPPPGAPTAPVVTPALGGLSVVWDGALDDGTALPADFDHVAVHVTTEDGFTPAPATFAGTITKAGEGGRLPVTPLPYQAHYVRLLGVNTSGVNGAASAQTAATPAKVDGPDLTAGSVTAGTIAAGAITAEKLEAVLALVTRIVAGDPAGSRVELNEDGLRVYNSSGDLTVRFDGATGDAVFTGAITGSTITGSLIQTADSGAAIVLNQDNNNALEIYDDDDNVVVLIGSGPPAQIISYTRGGGTLSTRIEGGRIYLGNADEMTGDPGTITAETGGTVHIEGHTDTGALAAPRMRFLPGSSVGTLEVSAAVGTAGITATGPLAASNIASGHVTITPSAANTPTSMVVSGLHLVGGSPRAVATATTTVPGSAVTGVGISPISSTSLTVWLTRNSTAATGVDWIAFAS